MIPAQLRNARKPTCALVQLPPVMDLAGAQDAAVELMACRGGPVSIDASEVQRLGALGLQVLISAHMTWEADGQDLSLAHPSSAFTNALELSGAAWLGGSSGE